NNGSLAGISGPVNVVSPSGRTDLVVDDSADTVGRTATITSNAVTGLSVGAISYTAPATAQDKGVQSVTIKGGHRANTFNVLSTAAFAPVNIVGGSGSNDVVRIGTPILLLRGSVMGGIAGDVKVSNPLGSTNLILNDSADRLARPNVVLTDHSVTG